VLLLRTVGLWMCEGVVDYEMGLWERGVWGWLDRAIAGHKDEKEVKGVEMWAIVS
jgi:hypothetical protein